MMVEKQKSGFLVKGTKCFVCGTDNPDGMKAPFEVNREDRTSHCRMVIPGRFQGWRDVIHGGILATLLDEACVHACRTVGPFPVTAEMTVKFRRPVMAGTEIVVRGGVTGQRRRLIEAMRPWPWMEKSMPRRRPRWY
ncbi:MAG: PaaI family thioesterase [Desulfuromonadales bacterium]|jgi:uncharacterized protein (TIGR00369 family)